MLIRGERDDEAMTLSPGRENDEIKTDHGERYELRPPRGVGSRNESDDQPASPQREIPGGVPMIVAKLPPRRIPCNSFPPSRIDRTTHLERQFFRPDSNL
jgi:hypothetical protein